MRVASRQFLKGVGCVKLMRSTTPGSESNDSVLLLSLHIYFWISFHVSKFKVEQLEKYMNVDKKGEEH